LERQLQEIDAIDFFHPTVRASTLKLLKGVMAKVDGFRGKHVVQAMTRRHVAEFQKKTWVTRSGVFVDRLASAWLIARFIDKEAKFKFVLENNYEPRRNEVRFDMFNAEFTHIGDRCTFEILVESFGIKSAGINSISEIIHDLDLNDTKYNRPETAGIGMILKGISDNNNQDIDRIEKATWLFDGLLKSFQSQ
jgi:hypothetical protein